MTNKKQKLNGLNGVLEDVNKDVPAPDDDATPTPDDGVVDVTVDTEADTQPADPAPAPEVPEDADERQEYLLRVLQELGWLVVIRDGGFDIYDRRNVMVVAGGHLDALEDAYEQARSGA